MNYTAKSNDCFKSRLRFYLYYCVTRKNSIINEDEFFEFEKPEFEKYILEYSSIYHQKARTFIINGKSLDTIYSEIKSLEKSAIPESEKWKPRYKKDIFSKNFPEHKFKELANMKECYYCGVTLDEINLLRVKGQLFKKNERGYSLELDRKLPNKGYSFDNCVMTCYWCNNAKTDEFTDVEFKPIGEAIGKALKARLK